MKGRIRVWLADAIGAFLIVFVLPLILQFLTLVLAP